MKALLKKIFFEVLIFFCLANTAISQKSEVIGYIKDLNNSLAKHNNISLQIDIIIKEKKRTIYDYTQKTIRYNDMLWSDALNTLTITNKKYKLSIDNNNKIMQVQYPVANSIKNEDILKLPFDSLDNYIDKVIYNKPIENNKRKIKFKVNKKLIDIEFVVDLETHLFDKITYFWYENDPSKPTLSMEMKFKNISFNEKIDESIFSEKKYLNLTNAGIELTDKYKNYRLILIR